MLATGKDGTVAIEKGNMNKVVLCVVVVLGFMCVAEAFQKICDKDQAKIKQRLECMRQKVTRSDLADSLRTFNRHGDEILHKACEKDVLLEEVLTLFYTADEVKFLQEASNKCV
ncbi:uncharacterized protein LOC135369304 [Ornithodoros turicata]|uniref:uncharacterized protein LOC135369304 n=1 Tax=Ornithodoros turicata TaxID=34597 RepID=UPI0031392232